MILLDTDVLIDVRRKHAQTLASLRALAEAGEEFGTTSLNAAELLRGSNRDAPTLATTIRILNGLVEVPFGPRAARRFGELMHALDRAGRPVPAIDGMIAAATLEAGARLATRNRRHFERISGLQFAEL